MVDSKAKKIQHHRRILRTSVTKRKSARVKTCVVILSAISFSHWHWPSVSITYDYILSCSIQIQTWVTTPLLYNIPAQGGSWTADLSHVERFLLQRPVKWPSTSRAIYPKSNWGGTFQAPCSMFEERNG